MCNLITYLKNSLNVVSELSQKKIPLQSTVIYFDHLVLQLNYVFMWLHKNQTNM